jgi:2,3-bisphosphoglycerate-independent phosphoglycerate mutase
MDGRDTSPNSGKKYIDQLTKQIKKIGTGKIASIIGRFYAMDRDNRWERVKTAYDAIVLGTGISESSPLDAIENSYKNKLTDEFIKPIIITQNDIPIGTVKDNDSIIFFNFRPDRARELAKCFTDDSFDGFTRELYPKTNFVCMTEYSKEIKAKVAFKPILLKNILADVLATNNKKQLHIAETEKYAHVTFFFNGGIEQPYPGEDRILIPSPKVETYDLKPEMSAYEVLDKLIEAIDSRKYDFIVLNLANPDMVGHTGVLDAAIKAMETVDKCVGKIATKIIEHDDKMILTSDHGNLEKMTDNKEPFTAHTTNNVPLLLIGKNLETKQLKKDILLADIAPTILQLLEIVKPEEMTGTSFILNR